MLRGALALPPALPDRSYGDGSLRRGRADHRRAGRRGRPLSDGHPATSDAYGNIDSDTHPYCPGKSDLYERARGHGYPTARRQPNTIGHADSNRHGRSD